jgi:hypothetical protein
MQPARLRSRLMRSRSIKGDVKRKNSSVKARAAILRPTVKRAITLVYNVSHGFLLANG